MHPIHLDAPVWNPPYVWMSPIPLDATIHLVASKHADRQPNIWRASKYTGGVQTCGASNHTEGCPNIGAPRHGESANMWGVQTYRWASKHMEGVQTYGGIQTYRGVLKHMGASKHTGGHPNMGASNHMGAFKHTEGASKHMGASKHTGGIQMYGAIWTPP